MTQLPAGGRNGPTPEWPLSEATPAELGWWARFWTKPQAAAWEREELGETVARYVRLIAQFDAGKMNTALLVELRNLEDRLGLNPVAMLKLRWEVSADELAERRDVPAAPTRPMVVDRRVLGS